MDQHLSASPRSLRRALRALAPPTFLLLSILAAVPTSRGQEAPAAPADQEHRHHHAPPAHANEPRSGEPFECHDLRHDFSDAERWSAMFDSPERREWQKPAELIALMEIEPGMTVADLGAGTGYFLEYLSAAIGKEGRVLALEPEATLVEFMNQRAAREGWPNVEARRIPYDDPELAAGSVDRLLIVNTWHHIEERPTYAAKLRQALAADGRIYIVDFTLDSPSGPPREHRLEPDAVRSELEGGGLTSEMIEEDLPRQYVVVGRRDGR